MNEIIDTLRAASDRLSDYAGPTDPPQKLSARDWAAFFQALAGFASVLIPLILPLFAQTESEK
jgi:hypothetical protein